MKILLAISTLLYLLFFTFLGMNANAEEEVDRLSLAALLIKNQNFSRAQSVLSEIKDPHEVIPEKYWALTGVLELKQKRFDKALVAFKNAEKEGLKSADLFEGQAKAYLGLEKYDLGLKVLSQHDALLEKRPLFYQLGTSLYFGKGEGEKAWRSLHQGMEKFPGHLPLAKQKWFYLMENKLVEVSFSAAKHMMDNYELSALDVARMGQMYRRVGDIEKAIFMGEVARLKDPRDEEIIKDLARSYIKKENLTAAAQIFTDLAHYEPQYLVEASELWRQAGYPVYAERLALDIRDPVKKVKQNLTLALLNEDFNKMAALGSQAQRTELKSDQDIQYALAYAHFMLGSFDQAETHLKFIQRPDLFKKALALREAIVDCENGENLCL